MKYTFIADESIERSAVEWLRKKGYTVIHITEYSPGISDTDVLKLAWKKKSILITNDKDFGDLVFRQRKKVSGIILVRADDETVENKIKLIDNVLKKAEDKLRGVFIVVNERGIRIR